MKARKKTCVLLLTLVAALSLGPAFDPEEIFKRILTWEKPVNYPPPMLEGMDVDTLSALLDSGNLQWYEPRPDPDKWETMVGLKVHAPPEVVWEVITDYPALCKIMPLTYLACETEYRKGNEVKNNQKGQTSIIKFAYKYDIIDIVTEDPPYNLHVSTIEGLEDRELTMLIIPTEDKNTSLFFMRYYLNMAALGYTMEAMLKVVPTMEPPTAVNANNYHSRAYKNEAEERVGYKAPLKPKPLDNISHLDLDTLRRIAKMGGGLIRETPQGEIIDALTFTFIDASPERVWEVLTDFEHYVEIFNDEYMKIESRDKNQLIVLEKKQPFSVLIFSLDRLELHARYTLEPPSKLSYYAIDGLYEGSYGDYRILPIENEKNTLLFHTSGFNFEKDTSLTARILKSGAFPMKNMFCVLGAQTSVANVRREAERREAEAKTGAGPY